MSWFQVLERRSATLLRVVMHLLRCLLLVWLVDLWSMRLLLLLPPQPAAVVLASPSTTAPAVVTVKAERLKYASNKDQRPCLDNTQRVGLEALEKWFKDTPASRSFLIKYLGLSGKEYCVGEALSNFPGLQ